MESQPGHLQSCIWRLMLPLSADDSLSSLTGNKDVFLSAIISAVHITSHLCSPRWRGVTVSSYRDNKAVSLRNVTLAGEPAERRP